MDEKKQSILDTAMCLFLEKGFQKTSVQDIAEACNMSKATIYKFFSAKEDIAVGVMLYINKQVVFNMREIERQLQWTPKERLRANILLLLTDYQPKIKFIDLMHFSFSPDQREQYLPILAKARFLLFFEYVNSILHTYDLLDESMAWELCINMNGIIREVSFLDGQWDHHKEADPLAKEVVADFIIDSLSAIISERRYRPPLITNQRINRIKAYFLTDCPGASPMNQIDQILEELRHKISKELPPAIRQDLLDAITLLEQERQKPAPKRLVMEALWLYLAQNEELTPLLNQLKKIKI